MLKVTEKSNQEVFKIPSLEELIKNSNKNPILSDLYEKKGYWKHYAFDLFPSLASEIEGIPIITFEGIDRFFYNMRNNLTISTVEMFYINEFYNSHFNRRNYNENPLGLAYIMKTSPYDINAKFLVNNAYDYKDVNFRKYILNAMFHSGIIDFENKDEVKNMLKFFSDELVEGTGDDYFVLTAIPPHQNLVMSYCLLSSLKKFNTKKQVLIFTQKLLQRYSQKNFYSPILNLAISNIADVVEMFYNITPKELFNFN